MENGTHISIVFTLSWLYVERWLGWGQVLNYLWLNCLNLFYRIPIWPYAKLILTSWLVIPYFSGAAYVYEHYVRPFFVNPQNVNIWYVPSKKDSSGKPEDVLTAAEKYIEEHGTEAFENLLSKVSPNSICTIWLPNIYSIFCFVFLSTMLFLYLTFCTNGAHHSAGW